ncbi:hypothetical protein AURDEDRAFT_161255 [Auricularia subglabra TFB-10046 SS5]|nr:hypothetical protein AURDEDRAFT_161255 [Auricularia subglabra TFB-10046 SS5]
MPSERTEQLVLFPIKDHVSWDAYKGVSGEFWTVEEHINGFDARRLAPYALLATLIRWMEISVNGGYLGSLCAAARTAEARMFWGTHVMRYNMRLEAFSYLAAAISSANGERLAVLEDEGGANEAAQHRVNFVEHIANKLPNPPRAEDQAALALIVHVVFTLGSLAVLQAIREEVGDAVPFLEIVDPMLRDVHSLTWFLICGFKFDRDVHPQWVSAAVDIERDMIRTHTPPQLLGAAMRFFDDTAMPVIANF